MKFEEKSLRYSKQHQPNFGIDSDDFYPRHRFKAFF